MQRILCYDSYRYPGRSNASFVAFLGRYATAEAVVQGTDGEARVS